MKRILRKVVLVHVEGYYISNYGTRGKFHRNELLACGHTWSKYSEFGRPRAAKTRDCKQCHDETISVSKLMAQSFTPVQLEKMSDNTLLFHWNKIQDKLIGTGYERHVLTVINKRGGFPALIRKEAKCPSVKIVEKK